MRAIQILIDEHRQIERVLVVFRCCLGHDLNDLVNDPALFLRGAEFIREFADGSHHAKEEAVLFRAMSEHGVPLESGPLACMLSEHDQGRSFARGIADAAVAMAQGDASARPKLIECTWSYSRLLLLHIYKEEQFAFALARQVLPPELDEELVRRYAQVDGKSLGAMSASAAALEGALASHGRVLPPSAATW